MSDVANVWSCSVRDLPGTSDKRQDPLNQLKMRDMGALLLPRLSHPVHSLALSIILLSLHSGIAPSHIALVSAPIFHIQNPVIY